MGPPPGPMNQAPSPVQMTVMAPAAPVNPYGQMPPPYPGPAKRQAKLCQPTEPKDSMRFFQVPARPWWVGLLALVAFGGIGYYLLSYWVVPIVVYMVYPQIADADGTTPGVFLANNLVVAMDIPICVLFSWLFFKQGFGWLVSVVGRFRWKWAFLTFGIFLLGYGIEMAAEVMVYGVGNYGFSSLQIKPYTWFMLAVILLTTPLQCAAEEFQARALLPRLVAAIVPHRWMGLILSGVLPSGVFMYLHHAQDFWLNVNYFSVGMIMWWLAYRTGGIEASIALHLVNNFFAEWTLPFTDFSNMFDRSEGTGSPYVLIYVAVQAVLVLLVDVIARKKGIVRLSAPAAATPLVVKPRRFITRPEECTYPATPADLPRMARTPRLDPEPYGFDPDQPYGAAPQGPASGQAHWETGAPANWPPTPGTPTVLGGPGGLLPSDGGPVGPAGTVPVHPAIPLSEWRQVNGSQGVPGDMVPGSPLPDAVSGPVPSPVAAVYADTGSAPVAPVGPADAAQSGPGESAAQPFQPVAPPPTYRPFEAAMPWDPVAPAPSVPSGPSGPAPSGVEPPGAHPGAGFGVVPGPGGPPSAVPPFGAPSQPVVPPFGAPSQPVAPPSGAPLQPFGGPSQPVVPAPGAPSQPVVPAPSAGQPVPAAPSQPGPRPLPEVPYHPVVSPQPAPPFGLGGSGRPASDWSGETPPVADRSPQVPPVTRPEAGEDVSQLTIPRPVPASEWRQPTGIVPHARDTPAFEITHFEPNGGQSRAAVWGTHSHPAEPAQPVTSPFGTPPTPSAGPPATPFAPPAAPFAAAPAPPADPTGPATAAPPPGSALDTPVMPWGPGTWYGSSTWPTTEASQAGARRAWTDESVDPPPAGGPGRT